MAEESILQKLWKVQTDILDQIVKICDAHGLRYYLTYGSLLGAVRHSGFIPWDDDLDIMMPRKDYEIFLKVAPKELSSDYFLQCDQSQEDYWLNFAKVRKNNTLFEEFSEDIMGENAHTGIFVDIFPLDSVKNPDSFVLHIKAIFAKALNETRYYKKGIFTKSSLNYKVLDQILKIFSQKTLGKWYNRIVIAKKDENYPYYVDLFTDRNYKLCIAPKKYYGNGVKLKFMEKEYMVPDEYDRLLTKEYGDYMKIPAPEDRVTHNTSRILFDVKNNR